MKKIVILVVFSIFLTGHLLADDKQIQVEDKIKQAIAMIAPSATVDSVEPAPIAGLYQVVIGTEVFYFSEDAQYLFTGDLINLATGINEKEQVVAGIRNEMLAKVPEELMVVYPAEKEEHKITVFTDIDCPYCRKLHQEVPVLNQNGITVRYVFFVPSGPGSNSYKKAISAWCADNQTEAVTQAKNGLAISPKSCLHPIDAHYQLGLEMGVRGTPFIMADNGVTIPGYRPAAEILKVFQ